MAVFALVAVYAERKISGFIQDRLGPMETGRFGLLQTFADIIKLLTKEDIIPNTADKFIFKLAPLVIFVAVFAGFACIPLGVSVVGAGLSVGIFYVLGIISLDVIGILMAGWSSNSKYALLGAMRAVAQIISYEIPLGLVVLCVVMINQSLDLQEIGFKQGVWALERTFYFPPEPIYLFGVTNIEVTKVGGFLTWNIVQMPFLLVGFVIYFIASLAECNRAPFDIPEAESEIIAGYHTEYSGLRWAFMMLAEYGMMLLTAFLAVILFLGSWNTPFPNIGFLELAYWTSGNPNTLFGQITALFWIFFKVFCLVFVQMWIRWTYPRLRADQLMYLCWKVLIPFAMVLVLLCAVWRIFM